MENLQCGSQNHHVCHIAWLKAYLHYLCKTSVKPRVRPLGEPLDRVNQVARKSQYGIELNCGGLKKHGKLIIVMKLHIIVNIIIITVIIINIIT